MATENELEAFKADLLDPFLIRSRPMKTTKPPCWHYNRQWIWSKPFETLPGAAALDALIRTRRCGGAL